MKKWRDRVWAKAAAFVLTLVCGAVSLLGGLGIIMLAQYNVFLDGGAELTVSLYGEQCFDAIEEANSFLHGTLANAGLLSSDGTYDYAVIDNPDITSEEQQQVLDDLPRVFAEEFPRESSACHLALVAPDTGEITFENFALTDGDKPLYTAQATFPYTLYDGHTEYLTIQADLLQAENAPSYSYLVLSWLLDHTNLTLFLTVLFGLLAAVCFCFSLAAAGHWPEHEGIHLTWVDRIPADVWVTALLSAFFIGWNAFYIEWGRVALCAALTPFILLFLCTFAAQCKAGTVIRGTLTARVLRWLWRMVRRLAIWLWRIGTGIPLVWKTALVGTALAFLEFYLYEMNYYGEFFVALKLAELLVILAVALNLRTLEKNGKQLSEGDLSTPVDTKRLFGAFRRYGQAMNRLQSGMESAVQEQMRAERMKTELITNVSHDIKTPLTSIVNYVDLLKKEDIPSPIAREYITVLDRQSKRLKKLTEDLVEASKASSGALPVDLQPTDVGVLFSQITGEYQDRLADCHLTLVTQPPAGQPVVLADSKLLSRVMDNLMSNVCKYALPETRVYVSGAVDGGQMTLSFKNVSRAELNISPDELMERFVRGDASRHTEGSGLGLSIAQSLVQLMGGAFRLSIDADLFRADVTLPLAQ